MLSHTAASGHLEVGKFLVEEGGAGIALKDDWGRTALVLARREAANIELKQRGVQGHSGMAEDESNVEKTALERKEKKKKKGTHGSRANVNGSR